MPPAPSTVHAPSALSDMGLDPTLFLTSAVAFGVCFLFAAGRALVWLVRRQHPRRGAGPPQPASRLPLFVALCLALSLGLRCAWATLRWLRWDDGPASLDARWMYLCTQAPLLLQMTAFSAISLSWMHVMAGDSAPTRCVRRLIWLANSLLYLFLIGTLAASFWNEAVFAGSDYAHQPWHIANLLLTSGWCVALSVIFTVYGCRIRRRLAGYSNSNPVVKRANTRILVATVVCASTFLVRGAIFGTLTITYNLEDYLPVAGWNRVLYPLAVYTVPCCLSSVSILLIMHQKEETRRHRYSARGRSCSNTKNKERSGSSSIGGGGWGEYGTIGDVKDSAEYSVIRDGAPQHSLLSA